METRRCSKCGVVKDADQFYSKGGQCKTCLCAYQKERRESPAGMALVAKQRAKYRRAHTGKIAIDNRRYRETNDERIKAFRRRNYAENKQQIKQQHAEYASTPDGMTSRIWQRLNWRTVNGSNPKWHNARTKVFLDKGTRLEMSKDELFAVVKESWPAIQAMRAAGEVPSIDRKNPAGHYSKDNVQIITWSENSRRIRRPISRPA